MKKCLSFPLLMLLFVQLQAIALERNSEKVDPLAAPIFNQGEYPVTGPNITLYFYNPNPDSKTQVFRSRSFDSGYELVATLPQAEEYFSETLPVRTTFHYKLKAIRGTEVSPFSHVQTLTTGSSYYAPTMTAKALSPTSIEISVTDNTYADVAYELDGSDGLFINFNLPDSGSTFTYVHTDLTPGATYSYYTSVYLEYEGFPREDRAATATVTLPTENESLSAPNFVPWDNLVFGPVVTFNFSNPNVDSETQVFRSRDLESGYELVATLPWGTDLFQETLPVRTTFHYKLRAIKGTEVSEFSEVLSVTTGSLFYPPTMSARALSPTSVEITVTDNTYADHAYDLDGTNGLFVSFSLPDSGSTYTYVDSGLTPGTTYTYYSDVWLIADGYPRETHVASVTVTTPDASPTVDGFILIDSRTNQDVGTMSNGDVITTRQFNVRVNSSSPTKSVSFVLNGKQSIDNASPFSVFAEKNNDFKNGHLKEGVYSLTATPYSGVNATGIAGESVTITFTVEYAKGKDTNPKFTYNLYPNPVQNLSALEIEGKPLSAVKVNIYNQHGLPVKQFAPGRLDSSGLLRQEINASELGKGMYILMISVNGEISNSRFFIK